MFLPFFRQLRVAIFLVLLQASRLTAQVPSPENVVGFAPGTDKKLLGWDKVVDYFKELAEKSERVNLQVLGESTLGKPFVMALISEPNNLKNLARFKNLQKQASEPYQLSDSDALLLAHQNKLFVAVMCNIDASETASGQAALELAYTLASSTSPDVQKILKNVILLCIPSVNPDGMQMVADWYHEYVNTAYEGSPVPFLTHPFAGVENNDDWLTMNLVETRLLARQFFQEWFPHVVVGIQPAPEDGPRVRIPLCTDPADPNLHPLLISQMNEIRRQLFRNLVFQGVRGVAQPQHYRWSQGRSLTIPWWHNMLSVGIEIVNADFATAIFYPRGSVKTQFSDNSPRWPGGWWRLRDAVKYTVESVLAFLNAASEKKESIIYNYCKMNGDGIRQGRSDSPFAYVIPADQFDPVSAVQVVQVLRLHGVRVMKTDREVDIGMQHITSRDFVVPLAQPLRPLIRDIFENRRFRTATPGDAQNFPRPSAWSLPLMTGLKVLSIRDSLRVPLTPMISVRYPQTQLKTARKGDYVIRHVSNRSFIAVNRLLQQGKKVYWLTEEIRNGAEKLPAGTIFIPYGEMNENKMDFLAQELALSVEQVHLNVFGKEAYRLRKYKLGLYQSWIPNPDEGWTRFLLEQYFFPFKTIYSSDIRRDNLRNEFDVIILPDMALTPMIEGNESKADGYLPEIPKPYLEGIGTEGVENLRQFVLRGGTLVALNRACDLPVQKFGLPTEYVRAANGTTAFSEAGAFFKIMVDAEQPLAYGMPPESAAFLFDSRVFRPVFWQRKTRVVAYYAESNSLLDGLDLDVEKLRGYSAVLDVPLGQGRVVLIGFRPQYQAKTSATYKFLFNAIQLSAAELLLLK